MVPEQQRQQIVRYVEDILNQTIDTPSFQSQVRRLLSGPGRVLCSTEPIRWSGFVLKTCEVLGGRPLTAVPAAAAIEFMVATAEVTDALVDRELNSTANEKARLINASYALPCLIHRCITDLSLSLGSERAISIGTMLCNRVAHSLSGEDRDIELEALFDVSLDDAYDMTCRKSGSLTALAFQVGAATATTDQRIIDSVGEFGLRVGIVSQLLNDIKGLSTGDVLLRKKTLPVAYALRSAAEDQVTDVLDWYRHASDQSNISAEQIANRISELGGLHFTLVVADTVCREALSILDDLARTLGRDDVLALQDTIRQVWTSDTVSG